MKLRRLLFFILITTLVACRQKFDKKVWQSQNSDKTRMSGSSARAAMVKDLLVHYPLVGKDTTQIIQLLGLPDYADSAALIYEMVIEYDGIDPDYDKSLRITLKDRIATAAEIHEWKKH